MPASNTTFQIRPMTAGEVGIAIDWAAREGWNPGLNDARCFYAADPGGFLVGLLGNEPVAVISAVKYGKTFGFIGLYIVEPQFRGRGFGLRLWRAATERLQGRVTGLDGVVEQQDNYKKSGFRYCCRNARYEGKDFAGGADGGVFEVAPEMFDEVRDYDRTVFSEERDGFLKEWIFQNGAACVAVRRRGRLTGYGVLRPCRDGYKAGPLFADSRQEAEAIFFAMTRTAGKGVSVFLDVPGDNPLAAGLAEKHGMKTVFETARMYKGDFPAAPSEKVFGITSFELG
ncbi:MAG: GNAT family N-acetyltransferase [Thermodesulfobacteriota bacterium]